MYELPRCDSEMHKSHLYHAVSLSTCIFYVFTIVFIIELHALSISIVYMLPVTLNITQSIT